MIAAVLVAAAVWITVTPPAHRRARAVLMSSDARPRELDTGRLALVLTPVAGFGLLGWPWGIVAGLAVAPLVRDAVRRLESGADRRRAERIVRDLPAGLDLVTSALASGRPPARALEVVADALEGPLADDLAVLVGRLAVSADVRLATIDAPDSLRVLSRALRRASESGAPVASVVATAADEVRREARAQRREAARRVGVRTAAPLGLCFLPAFLLVGIVPTVISIAGTLSFL